LAGCLGAAAGAVFAFGSLIILFIVAVRISSGLMQRFVISMAYGANRYDAGLRIVNNKCKLSDGSFLPLGWEWLFMLGTFVGVCLILIPYCFLLQRIGLLRSDNDDKTPPTADKQSSSSAVSASHVEPDSAA